MNRAVAERYLSHIIESDKTKVILGLSRGLDTQNFFGLRLSKSNNFQKYCAITDMSTVKFTENNESIIVNITIESDTTTAICGLPGKLNIWNIHSHRQNGCINEVQELFLFFKNSGGSLFDQQGHCASTSLSNN